MTLFRLLDGVEYTGCIEDCEINAIASDSRQAEPGSVFVCISGQRSDGHEHASQAIEKGAAAVVCSRDLGLPRQVLVPDTRAAYGIICANFFENPAKKLKLMGVTGTNGKTTVTYLMKQILECAGKTVGLIGTIHNEIADMRIPARYTTPDPLQLHAMFARMVDAGCEYVVMEVSSHALDQHRVAGCRFLTAAFTNLTQDHLDYHHTMEEYYEAKKKLFAVCDTAVLNLDDAAGRRLWEELSCNKLTFSCANDNTDFTAHEMKFSAQGSRFALLHGEQLKRVRFCMPGGFSVSNALAAVTSCVAAGIDLDTAVRGLESCSGVPGRLEILPVNAGYTVIRDYAHSPDGLEKVLTAVREFATGRIVTLFGCAGNRDRTKRPKMGEIVSRLSDFCILTSDNPRDESPQRITEDVLPGILEHDTPYTVIVNRYDAIVWALDFVRDGDVLLLCGKGHEDYQVLDYGTIHFDEKEIVLELLKLREKE